MKAVSSKDVQGKWVCDHGGDGSPATVWRSYEDLADGGDPFCPVCDDIMYFAGQCRIATRKRPSGGK